MRDEFPLTWGFWVAGLLLVAGMVNQSLHDAALARVAFLILALLLLVALGAIQVRRRQ